MAYQQKKIITHIIAGVLFLSVYCVYAFIKLTSGAAVTDDLKFWAGTMLVFIGIGIAAMIVIQIVFHIFFSVSIAVKEKIRNHECDDKGIEKSIKQEMVEDERDKLIELKSMRVGVVIAGIGFVAALISLVLNNSPVIMLNILFISFMAGSVLESFARLYLYK